MNNILAKIISYAFHPILVVFYLFVFTLFSYSYKFIRYNLEFKLLLTGFVILAALIVPLVSILTMKKAGIIHSVNMEEKGERNRPYMMMFFVYIITAASMLGLRMIDPILILIFLNASILVILVFSLNRLFKISAHSAAMGASVSWIFFMQPILQVNFGLHFIIAILLAGLVMSSRLQLKAHTGFEVVTGLFLGVLQSGAVLWYASRLLVG